jgi:glycosyltransferase involved in cell wall biosynthesis
MKVTIITVCFNSSSTIQETLKSVTNQDYEDIEYIVIDGRSNDGTLEIIKGHQQLINKCISEPDDGLYYAMNKGLELATGDVIGFMNSDDIFNHDSCVSEIMNTFNTTDADIVYGDIVYTDPKDTSRIVRYWKSGEFEIDSHQRCWMPPHPATYIKRSIFEKFGNFNTDFKIAADYELLLRFIFTHKIYPVYLSKIMVRMRTGGLSNASIRNIIISNIEVFKSHKANLLDVSIWKILLKPLRKLRQYFVKFNN